jgi:hypothetical protein
LIQRIGDLRHLVSFPSPPVRGRGCG